MRDLTHSVARVDLGHGPKIEFLGRSENHYPLHAKTVLFYLFVSFVN